MNDPFQVSYVLVFTTAMVVSALLTPLFRYFALRTLKFVQWPKPISIETHVQPIPVGGGLAIFLGVVAALWLTRPLSSLEQHILLAGGILVAFGLLDDSRTLSIPSRPGRFLSRYLLDKRSLSTLSKFAAQFFVAFLVVLTPKFGGETLMPRISGSTVLNQAVAILWIVGVINAINFLDIMDGLAAGVSAIAAIGFFFLASFVGQGTAYAGLAIALAGSALGFLIYNFEPASIFMGDAGSQFLGFILGTLALLVASSSTSFVTVVSPIVLLGIPLFEITFTMTVRTLTGKAFWKGSKDHYPLRMFQLGFTVRQIVLASYVVGLVLLWCSIWMTQASLTGQLITLVILALIAIGAGLWLSRVEVPRPSTSTKPATLSASTGKPSDVEVTKGTRWAKE